MAAHGASPDAGPMRSHSSRPVVALLVVVALALLAGCGDKDTSSGSSDSPTTATEADATDDAGGGGAAIVDVPKSGVRFNEALDADDLSPEQASELQIMLSVLGMDHAGYVSGSTIVVQTTEADLDDRQFTCIAAGQSNKKDKQYKIVVVDETGKDLGC